MGRVKQLNIPKPGNDNQEDTPELDKPKITPRFGTTEISHSQTGQTMTNSTAKDEQPQEFEGAGTKPQDECEGNYTQDKDSQIQRQLFINITGSITDIKAQLTSYINKDNINEEYLKKIYSRIKTLYNLDNESIQVQFYSPYEDLNPLFTLIKKIQDSELKMAFMEDLPYTINKSSTISIETLREIVEFTKTFHYKDIVLVNKCKDKIYTALLHSDCLKIDEELHAKVYVEHLIKYRDFVLNLSSQTKLFMRTIVGDIAKFNKAENQLSVLQALYPILENDEYLLETFKQEIIKNKNLCNILIKNAEYMNLIPRLEFKGHQRLGYLTGENQGKLIITTEKTKDRTESSVDLEDSNNNQQKDGTETYGNKIKQEKYKKNTTCCPCAIF